MMYVRVLYELKSAVEPKRCLLLDVCTSSLEVDLRVPGNRDEFPSVNSPRFVRNRGSSVYWAKTYRLKLHSAVLKYL